MYMYITSETSTYMGAEFPQMIRKRKVRYACCVSDHAYVLHIDLKALDIGNPSSLGSPKLLQRSPKLELCHAERLLCMHVELAPLGKPKYHDINGFFTQGVHLTNDYSRVRELIVHLGE